MAVGRLCTVASVDEVPPGNAAVVRAGERELDVRTGENEFDRALALETPAVVVENREVKIAL